MNIKRLWTSCSPEIRDLTHDLNPYTNRALFGNYGRRIITFKGK